jgi:hypothetical protein
MKSRYFPAPSIECGVLAQLVERLNGIEEVRGSIPLGSMSILRALKPQVSRTFSAQPPPYLEPRAAPGCAFYAFDAAWMRELDAAGKHRNPRRFCGPKCHEGPSYLTLALRIDIRLYGAIPY